MESDERELNLNRAEAEMKNKKFYEISKSQMPKNADKLKSRMEVINAAQYGRQNQDTSIVIFDQEQLRSVCFGTITSLRKSRQMKSKNDVAVSVLAHAKSRISEFVRKVNDCLPSRLFGVSLRVTMTDTDSVAYQVRCPIFLQRHKLTKELIFSSPEVKQTVLDNLGADKFKEHIELFLSGSPEMSRIVDRAHFTKDKLYYDASRKKQVGLYADEIPLKNMITSFQACGPKNYQYRKIEVDKDGKTLDVSKVRHKGISKHTDVTELDYSNLIILWDKSYNASHSVMGYDPHNRQDVFKDVRVGMVDTPVNSKKNLALVAQRLDLESKNLPLVDPETKKNLPKPRTKKMKKLANVECNKNKLFTSHSFYTTQAGVFMTRIDKRLGVTPSDKVLFPRAHFGSYSVGSRFARAVRKFNDTKTYHELFSDEHLNNLCELEINFLDKEMERYYPNGVQAERLIRLDEQIDQQVCVEYLFRQHVAAKRDEEEKARLTDVLHHGVVKADDRTVDYESDEEAT